MMKKITAVCTVVYNIECDETVTEDRIKDLLNSHKPFASGTVWGDGGAVNYRTDHSKFKIETIQ